MDSPRWLRALLTELALLVEPSVSRSLRSKSANDSREEEERMLAERGE